MTSSPEGVSAATYFRSSTDFRRWLQRHHGSVGELVVGFYKTTSGKKSITYHEALDQALCYGWIDGVRRSVDAERYTIRFTPRRPRSYWSKVNLARFEALKLEGLVASAGDAALARRDRSARPRYSNERGDTPLQPEFQRAFEANRAAWAYFSSQAPSYQRVARHWVMSAVQESTRTRRFAQLLTDSASGRRLAALLPPRKRPR